MDQTAILSVMMGVGLSAACGFRVFVPLLALSIGVRFGFVDVSEGFSWIGTLPALVSFATATVLEVGAYFIPWVDNLLDSAATPLSVVAGTVVTASFIVDMHPMLQWGVAAIAGGGAAGAVQGLTVITRAVSSAATGGIANPIVSVVEAGASVVMSIVAMLVPVLAIGILALLVLFLLKKLWDRRRRTPAAA